MAYEFAGYFARPTLPRPPHLPSGGVWRDVEVPFVGIGVRLPSLIDEDSIPSPAELHTLARQLGLDDGDCWLYLTYVCWGGDIDFVYGLGSRGGMPFGPIKEDAPERVEAAYTDLMAQFGISAEAALRFDPFNRGYWGED